MKTLSNVLLFLLLFGSNTAIFAENDQTIVIGLGVGIHHFSDTDDLRHGMIEDINIAGASNLYIEWYAFEGLGIGLRSNTLGVTETLVSWFSSYEREYSIRNNFITLNWVPVGATSYTRFGLVAGLGNSEYEYTERMDGATVFHSSSTGPASLLGGFVDWGGEDFGARFSLNFLNTELDDLSGYRVDASGSNWTLDLRWAFK